MFFVSNGAVTEFYFEWQKFKHKIGTYLLRTLEVVQGSKPRYLFHTAPRKDALRYPLQKKYFDFALSLIINFLEHIKVWCRLS